MKLGMDYNELKFYTVHINNDPGLTLTYFTPMSNLAKLVFVPRYQVSVYRTIGPLVIDCENKKKVLKFVISYIPLNNSIPPIVLELCHIFASVPVHVYGKAETQG